MTLLVYLILMVSNQAYTASGLDVLAVGKCKDIKEQLNEVNPSWIKNDIKSAWGVTHLAVNPKPDLNAMSFKVNEPTDEGDVNVEFVLGKLRVKGPPLTYKETIQSGAGPKEMITKTAEGKLMKYYVLHQFKSDDSNEIMYVYKCTDDESAPDFDARYVLAKDSALSSDLKAKIDGWERDFSNNNVFIGQLFSLD